MRIALIATVLLWSMPGFAQVLPSGDPPAISGTLQITASNQPQLVTATKTYDLGGQLWSWGMPTKVGLRAADYSSFAGLPITVKGWADETAAGNPLFLVEEFGPGTSPDFVTGRVSIGENCPAGDANCVSIHVRQDKYVAITNPALREKLRLFNDSAFILPGAVTHDLGADGKPRWEFSGNPDQYYLLTMFHPGTAVGSKFHYDKSDTHAGEGSTYIVSDTDVSDRMNARIWVKGHIPDPGEPIEGMLREAPLKFLATWVGIAINEVAGGVANSRLATSSFSREIALARLEGANVARDANTTPVAPAAAAAATTGGGVAR